MLGRMMNLQAVQNAARFFRRKSFIQRSRFMRIEIVHHHDDLCSLGILDVDPIPDDVRKIHGGPAFGDVNLAASGLRKVAPAALL